MNGLRRTAAAALLIVSMGAGCSPKPATQALGEAAALTFIENDYPRALAAARQANVPLFVEVWAPW